MTSASSIKIILGITTFSQYVKELHQAKGLKRKALSKCLIIDDVKIMNLQTYRKTIVKHQYERTFKLNALSFTLSALSLLGGG